MFVTAGSDAGAIRRSHRLLNFNNACVCDGWAAYGHVLDQVFPYEVLDDSFGLAPIPAKS